MVSVPASTITGLSMPLATGSVAKSSLSFLAGGRSGDLSFPFLVNIGATTSKISSSILMRRLSRFGHCCFQQFDARQSRLYLIPTALRRGGRYCYGDLSFNTRNWCSVTSGAQSVTHRTGVGVTRFSFHGAIIVTVVAAIHTSATWWFISYASPCISYSV